MQEVPSILHIQWSHRLNSQKDSTKCRNMWEQAMLHVEISVSLHAMHSA
jgi:hypothetical protein